MTLTEFLNSTETYRFPAPGGALMTGAERSNDDADLFLSEVAVLVKKAWTPAKRVDLLRRKIGQIELQEHYGGAVDVKLIERMNAWIREISQ